MKTFLRQILLGAVLLLGACQAPEIPPDPNAVASVVAATLTAAPSTPPTHSPETSPTPAETATLPAAPPTDTPNRLLVTYIDTARNLWVWDGVSSLALSETGDVTSALISPDGAWVAYTRSADYVRTGLWVIAPDGTGVRELVSEADFAALPRMEFAITTGPAQVQWVPGTHTLAYNTTPRFEGPGFMLNDDLRLVNAETGEKSTLLEPGKGGFFRYSPDGSQIAVAQHRAVHLVNADGTDYRANVFTYHDINTASEYLYYADPVWTADGSALRMAIPPSEPWTETPEPSTLWHIPTNGEPAVQVGEVNALFFMDALHAPDGEHIAYISRVDPSGSLSTLMVAQYDGSGASEYRTGQINNIIWAPDARHFAFMDGTGPSTFVAGPDSAPELLTDVIDAYGVSWVDANRFLFLRKVIGGWELRLGELGQPSMLVAALENNESGNTPVYMGLSIK